VLIIISDLIKPVLLIYLYLTKNMGMHVALNNKQIIQFLFVFASLAILTSFETAAQVKPPNVILIIADDLGYSDLASYGNSHIQTPNIDALGKDGFRFTQAYVSAPICAPSREGIFTGRYQQRFGDEFMPYDDFDPAFIKNLHTLCFIEKIIPGIEQPGT